PGDLATFGNSHVPFHLSVYVYLCTDSIASTNVPRGTLRRLCRPMHQAALQLTLSCVRKRMRSGDRPGLQNRRAAGYPVTGGFDPHSLPPFLLRLIALQTGHFLQAFWIPSFFHLDLRRSGIDVSRVFGRQLDRHRSDVLFQAVLASSCRELEQSKTLARATRRAGSVQKLRSLASQCS